jgi:hypothetical protein
MAIAVDDTVARVTATAAFAGTALTATTASFTPPSGSLLVAFLSANESATNNAINGAMATTGLTWTKRAERGCATNGSATNSEGYVSCWTAPVVTGAAMTVAGTIDWPDNFVAYSVSLKVYIVTGQHASPIGQTGAAGPTTSDASGVLNPTLFTSSAGGRAFYGMTERNGGSGSAGLSTSTDTEDAQYNASDFVGRLSAYKAADHAAGAVVGSFDAAAQTVFNWAAVEIIAAAAGGSSTTATPGKADLTLAGKTPTATAFNSVRIREVLVNGSGQVVGSATDITLLVWYSGRFGGAPDVSLNNLTTDSLGTTSWSIATGNLTYLQAIAYVAQNSVSLSHYAAAHMVPSYE